MSTKTKRILGIVVAVIVLVFGALVIRVPTGPSSSEIREKVERSLPLSTSREKVSEFAKNEGMEHSPYLERERMITAIKRGVAKGLFSETSVYLRFYFDEKGGLQRYTVEEVSTGL